ncbi:hypothetical protein K491DRAFT_585036 [Lophiostoma macrostomum CBS 122681]|uniref:Uncharacterized protein n=1 Tax=Lophiostoma macrostomum CBS 122681 TaxID=1314788 RepID=A0A6A6TRM3_9PLEO|nr:hypothetical protein K491DRAFT_585036 [Lophiostoma macrostomum CBS 122681]
MAATVQESIQSAADRNATILAGLHETDSAPSQLYQQVNYITDLNAQLKRIEKQLETCKKRTASELADHKKYSESTFRRFAHKASGQSSKFTSKAAKEEREYFDAIQEQKTAEDDLAYARQLLAEAESTRAEYERNAQRHEALQRELDELYNAIFAGYTPGFPDEDDKEQHVNTTAGYCADINAKLEKEKQVTFVLRQILDKLGGARMYLDKAHGASTMDMWGGGTFTSMQKRNYLERAESSISQVRMLQDQLKATNSAVSHDLGAMNIASGSIWGDVVFDNIFSDMEMHDKIKQSEAQIQGAIKKCARKIKESEAREKNVQEELVKTNEALKKARVELQKAREQAFARVQGGERIEDARPQMDDVDAVDEAPPAYSA